MWLDIAKEYKKRIQDVHIQASTRMVNEVLRLTPVQTGSLRASWTASVGDTVLTNNITLGGGTKGDRNDLIGPLNTMTPGETYNLANGQPYARAIEFEGHSPQAPGGMMRIAALNWSKFVEEAVKNVK